MLSSPPICEPSFLPFPSPPSLRVTQLAALTAVQVVGLDDPLGVLGNAGTFDLLEEKTNRINKFSNP